MLATESFFKADEVRKRNLTLSSQSPQSYQLGTLAAEASKKLLNVLGAPSCWFAGVFARRSLFAPLNPSAAAEKLSGSRILSAEEI